MVKFSLFHSVFRRLLKSDDCLVLVQPLFLNNFPIPISMYTCITRLIHNILFLYIILIYIFFLADSFLHSCISHSPTPLTPTCFFPAIVCVLLQLDKNFQFHHILSLVSNLIDFFLFFFVIECLSNVASVFSFYFYFLECS